MTKEQIEAIVDRWPLRDVRELVMGMAVEVHNAAIEEAARVAECSWGEPQTSASIRALKVEP